jgi:hypothetical protein
MVLSDRQWKLIFPQVDGLLCPTCICKRAEKLDGAIRVNAMIMGSLMVPREPFEINFHIQTPKCGWEDPTKRNCKNCPDECAVRQVPYESPFKIKIVEAGVDPDHQTDHCDDCGHDFTEAEERIPTCTHEKHVTLCRPCYRKAGSSVR